MNLKLYGHECNELMNELRVVRIVNKVMYANGLDV